MSTRVPMDPTTPSRSGDGIKTTRLCSLSACEVAAKLFGSRTVKFTSISGKTIASSTRIAGASNVSSLGDDLAVKDLSQEKASSADRYKKWRTLCKVGPYYAVGSAKMA